jgi:hypothetical protein
MKLFKSIIGDSAILLFLLGFAFSCSNKSTESEEIHPLVGSWEISAMTTLNQGETETFNQSQLNEMGVIWKYIFSEDYSAEQITNISGSLLSMPGTWSASETQLTLVLLGPAGNKGTLKYLYRIEDDILKLNWQLQDGPEYFAEFTKLNEEK